MIPSETIIYGTGILNRINLKHDKKNDSIHGRIGIKTNDNNIVSFNVYQKRVMNNGKNNPRFKAFNTVMKDYKDISNVDDPNDADIVTIKESNMNFPNAKITVKTDFNLGNSNVMVYKNLNIITRKVGENPKYGMIFKIYGCYVEDIKGSYIKCRIIDFNNHAQPILLRNKKRKDIKKDTVIDVGGYITEGLENGYPVCEYDLINIRVSKNYSKEDFIKPIKNYEDNVKKQTNKSPF